ncbi:MAG: hypothetical protein ACJ79S_06115 [Gemmatimonadaceae bacterium]
MTTSEPDSPRLAARAVKPDADAASPPEVLVVEPTVPAGATLFRYAASGAVSGETWYLTAEEAQACALRDYGAGLGPWRPMPPDVRDPVAFVLGNP